MISYNLMNYLWLCYDFAMEYLWRRDFGQDKVLILYPFRTPQDEFDNLLKTVQRVPPSPLFLLVLLVLPFAEGKELLG